MNKDKWLDWAEIIDALRVIPRIMMLGWLVFYMIYTWELTIWFFEVPDPTAGQTTFITAVISGLGTMSVWLGNLYLNSRRPWDKDDRE